ncbi:MAG: RidA family protein [Thermoguttaceae bacterium]|nr:RidA family protein [Thermoguttaceae bacterium]MDW8078520.1 RidA family protein [Thermoguttaceae bacterium]
MNYCVSWIFPKSSVRLSLLVLLAFIGAGGSGCTPRKPEGPSTAAPAQPAAQKASETAPTTWSVPEPMLVRKEKDFRGFARAVLVGGHPLLLTRQVLPVDRKGALPPGEGPDRLKNQVDLLLRNVETLLAENGSGWDKLVRIHGYVTGVDAAQVLIEGLASRMPEGDRPALSVVETPLPLEGAQVAIDVVAISAEDVKTLTLRRSSTIWGEEGFADVALLPAVGLGFFSGYPEKGEQTEAAAKSLGGLLELGQQLGVTRSDIAYFRAFVQPVSLANTVKSQLRKTFVDQLVPPAAYVEWIASAPVEVEMIAALRSPSALLGDKIRFYNPPGVKPSPTFTRVVLASPGVYIFTGGLIAQEAPDGVAEVRDIFKQLSDLVDQSGSDLRHLLKATYCVSGKESSAALDKLRPEYFDPARPPAASKVTVHGVAAKDRSIVVDMIALGSK